MTAFEELVNLVKGDCLKGWACRVVVEIQADTGLFQVSVTDGDLVYMAVSDSLDEAAECVILEAYR